MKPLFSISFRPFFILSALIAAINPILWVLSYLGKLSISLHHVDPLFWHGHEMIFAFSGALIAGFILTASAHWTNSKPYQGRPLVVLAIAWGIERASYFLPVEIHFQFVLMNIFFPVLALMLYLKLKNFAKQKYVFLPILLGITIAKIFHSYGYLFEIEKIELIGMEIAIGLVRLIVLLIAGRVIPFFTRKKVSGIEISLPKWANPLALVPIVLLALPMQQVFTSKIHLLILGIAIIGNITRQVLWKPFKTTGIPILYILHIGIAFINISLVLEFFEHFYSQIAFSKSAMHMLMAGGLGVIGIGIMTRVTLGHTGRVIAADKWTIFAYMFIVVGSLVRVFIPIFLPAFYFKSLYFSGGLWGLGFIVFFIRYFKIFISPRPDGKEW